MPVGIVSILTLELIRTKLKAYIDSKTVSNDFRYKNVDRIVRCASRFSNSNSRLIIPLFITLNNNLLNEMFPKEDGTELSSDEITALLLNGESILQIIKSDRDRWLEIEKKYGFYEKSTAELFPSPSEWRRSIKMAKSNKKHFPNRV